MRPMKISGETFPDPQTRLNDIPKYSVGYELRCASGLLIGHLSSRHEHVMLHFFSVTSLA